MHEKGGRILEREETRGEKDRKNPRMCGGRSALVDAAFQGTLNDFILLLHLYSSTFQETEDKISDSAFLSLAIKWDIELRVGVMTEHLLITGMYNLQNWEYCVM